MADPRFFNNAGPFTLDAIVSLTGAKLSGGGADSGSILFKDVTPLGKSSATEISFLDNVKYVDAMKSSKAGACFIHAKHAPHAPAGMLLLTTSDPYGCFALTAQKFYPQAVAPAAIVQSVQVAPTAKIGKNCTIAHTALIGENVEIGDNCSIGPGAVIYPGVMIGENSNIGANSTLSYCLVGHNVIIHRGVHIGQDGFGFAAGAMGHIKVPQLGRVVIGNDVEIGSGTCIDRGAGPDTVIGDGTKIDNLVQIGHNVVIGRHSIIVAQVGIAGSTHIGDGVMIGGQVGISGHLKIGSGARLAARAGLMTDVPEGESYGGSPAVPVRDWHRQTVAISRISKRKEAANE